ncbi:TetR/AcrR family transcriptional regulator [bacterium]|nr:MAG: TetR/AcrR family transcriptional regulator [bacterium]
MTEKKEQILDAALKLFAEQGYASTSTAKIAKAAGVSEGLIFRHFENKEGLLRAIMNHGKAQIDQLYKQASTFSNPKDVLASILSFPFLIPKDQHPYWKLSYSLKWQSDIYLNDMSEPIRTLLIDAFTKLAYQNPEAEAEAVLLILDGIATAVLLKKPEHSVSILKAIMQKYGI